MCSTCFEIGRLTIRWYGVMMAMAFLAALANWIRLGKKNGRDSAFCSDMLFWIMLSGIGGARIAYVIANIDYFTADPLLILRLDQGGLIYYGGFIGAGLAMYIFARKHNEKPIALFDFIITSVPLSHALGRIGCFLNGCCYGLHSDSWMNVRYPKGSFPWMIQVEHSDILPTSQHSLGLLPVQLFEALFNLVLFFVLVWVYKRRKRDGIVLAVYLLLYPVGRFCIEFLRGDERVRMAGLSIAQVVSIGLFVFGLVLLVLSGKKHRKIVPASDIEK